MEHVKIELPVDHILFSTDIFAEVMGVKVNTVVSYYPARFNLPARFLRNSSHGTSRWVTMTDIAKVLFHRQDRPGPKGQDYSSKPEPTDWIEYMKNEHTDIYNRLLAFFCTVVVCPTEGGGVPQIKMRGR